ncbi:MAG: hypothetical protein ACR2O3_00830 [Rhizobiaceae bacterium]
MRLQSIVCVTACLSLLSLVASLSTAQAQNPAPDEPSLEMPFSETPPELGDAARMYQAMGTRSDLRYMKKSMQVLGPKIAYVDEDKSRAHGLPRIHQYVG